MTPDQIPQLATAAFTFLLPHLNYLRGKITETALPEAGKALVEIVKQKWLAKNEAASAAVAEAAQDPTDTDTREAALAYLRKALKADPDFAAELARLLPEAAAQQDNRLLLNQSGDNNKGAVVTGQVNTVTIS